MNWVGLLLMLAGQVDSLPDQNYRAFLNCYVDQARSKPWSKMADEKLAIHESFALAVIKNCPEEIQPYRAAAENEVRARFERSGMKPDQKLLAIGTDWYLTQLILRDWPQAKALRDGK